MDKKVQFIGNKFSEIDKLSAEEELIMK